MHAGPPEVASRRDYRILLHAAGFIDPVEVDVTAAYLNTARAWLRRQREHAADLAALEPPGALDDRLARRRAAVAAIEAGLLRRSLFPAITPQPSSHAPRRPAPTRPGGPT